MSDNVIDRLYPELLDAHLSDEFAILDESLNPRPPQALLNLAGEARLDQGMIALDAGCGNGEFAALLARRHGCSVLGLDLALGSLRQATASPGQGTAEESTYFGQATIEALPLADETIDLVLSRDMLLHVKDLEKGTAEFGRVLKPGGSMIILATTAGEHLSQEEAAALFKPLAIVPENLVQERLEASYRQAGLAIRRKEAINGERLEYMEEAGGYYSRELLRLARMRRDPARYQQALGTERYQQIVALYTLSIYLLIGKLVDIVYWLEK